MKGSKMRRSVEFKNGVSRYVKEVGSQTLGKLRSRGETTEKKKKRKKGESSRQDFLIGQGIGSRSKWFPNGGGRETKKKRSPLSRKRVCSSKGAPAGSNRAREWGLWHKGTRAFQSGKEKGSQWSPRDQSPLKREGGRGGRGTFATER